MGGTRERHVRRFPRAGNPSGIELPTRHGLDYVRVSSITGIETTLEQVVGLVKELTRSRSEVRWGALAPHEWDTDRWVADQSLAASLLGWRARHGLREGLAKMAAWMNAV